MSNELRDRVFDLLDAERDKQEDLGKPSRHAFAVWFLILSDYIGKVSKYMWRMAHDDKETTIKEFLTVLLKPVAICVAWLENVLEIIDAMEVTTPPSEETLDAEFVDEESKEVEVTIADELEVDVSDDLAGIYVNE